MTCTHLPISMEFDIRHLYVQVRQKHLTVFEMK